MNVILGIPSSLLFGQLLLGLINGAFYAMMSLGLAVIFGMLGIINFVHGALFMMGAFVALLLLEWLGVNYWLALLLSPLIVGAFGILLERSIIRRLYAEDHVYAFLLTFGLALVIEGVFSNVFGSGGRPYAIPTEFRGVADIGFMVLPLYRAWAVLASVIVCAITWLTIEKTALGAKLRAATENARIVQALGVNVPLMMTATYAAGAVLAALAGVLAAPIYSVSPHMGTNLVIIVFAVVVIGGMGSIKGAVITGFLLGVVEGLSKVFYPAASATVIFLIMVLVLMVRPRGLFGREE